MSEIELKKEVSEYEQLVEENRDDLGMAYMALEELLGCYYMDYKPDARKAIEYGNTVDADKHCDKEAKWSWEYINDYSRIMWLVRIAKDYCFAALDKCEKTI